MKLTSIMRRNSAASDFANGADSALPAFAIRMSIGCRAAASEIAALGIRPVVADTVMADGPGRARVARAVLEAALEVAS